jgi:hypothetical protein
MEALPVNKKMLIPGTDKDWEGYVGQYQTVTGYITKPKVHYAENFGLSTILITLKTIVPGVL